MFGRDLDSIQQWSFIAGGVGLLGSLIGLFLAPTRFFQSYLFAYIFWLGLPIGCLGLLMLHHLTRGRWSFPLQRLLEAGTWTIPLMALLFIPIALGLDEIYPWAHRNPETMYGEMTVHAIEQKHGYLNIPFFLVRTVIYFICWGGLAWFLGTWSGRLDGEADLDALRRLRQLSGPGLVALLLTFSFAAVDWIMSLEPAWFSSIYGWMVLTGMTLEALLFVTLLLYGLGGVEPFDRLLDADHFHDLGNLIFTFLILWTYMMVMQYIIIWSGNLPEEIIWFMRRTRDGWEWLTILLAAFHFAVPFFLLLNRGLKRNALRLAQIAGGLLVMRLLAVCWLIKPSFRMDSFGLHWLDPVCLLTIGGIWLGIYAAVLQRHALVARHDPRMARTLGYEPEAST